MLQLGFYFFLLSCFTSCTNFLLAFTLLVVVTLTGSSRKYLHILILRMTEEERRLLGILETAVGISCVLIFFDS